MFIPTTWQKFVAADEINDLYDESPLEDRLWAQLKRLSISAERQEFVQINGEDYVLDFALYCVSGKIDIETDGDSYHSSVERIPLDNARNNALGSAGWRILRFNTLQINEQLTEYCVPQVLENINGLGGIDDGRLISRKYDPRRMDVSQQRSLFDDES